MNTFFAKCLSIYFIILKNFQLQLTQVIILVSVYIPGCQQEQFSLSFYLPCSAATTHLCVVTFLMYFISKRNETIGVPIHSALQSPKPWGIQIKCQRRTNPPSFLAADSLVLLPMTFSYWSQLYPFQPRTFQLLFHKVTPCNLGKLLWLKLRFLGKVFGIALGIRHAHLQLTNLLQDF